MAEPIQGTSTSKAFVYDSLGRLDQVQQNGVLVSEYDYDANGNRTALLTQAATVISTYDAN